MNADTGLLLYAVAAVVAFIVLIARYKLHPFVALISVSLSLGVATGMQLGAAVKAFQDGVGNTLGFIAIVVGVGTMLRRLHHRDSRFLSGWVRPADSAGVHHRAPHRDIAGQDRHPARRWSLGGARNVAATPGGDAGGGRLQRRHRAHDSLRPACRTSYGCTGGPHLRGVDFPAHTASGGKSPCEQLEGESVQEMPGFGISLFTVLMPVMLMLVASAADIVLDPASSIGAALHFIGHPIVALLLALLFSFWSLGRPRRFTREEVMKFCNDCLGPTATILLVIGAGGGFNQVLVQSGVGRAIADVAIGSHASPLLLAWIAAALIRVATGSATVAMTTAAGIVAPIALATPGTNAELLVLATGAGSLMLSHVDDAGFWLIKEFFNMTVPQTLKTWTVAETIIGVAGLGFTVLLSLML